MKDLLPNFQKKTRGKGMRGKKKADELSNEEDETPQKKKNIKGKK